MVFLCAYGMKIPLGEVKGLPTMQKPSINPMAKFVIKVNVDVPCFLLFKIVRGYEGTIYPMLLTGSSGSALMQLDVLESHNIRVEMKRYLRVVHAIKASGVTMKVPSTNGELKKVDSIRSFILQILEGNITVSGFCTEMCFQ